MNEYEKNQLNYQTTPPLYPKDDSSEDSDSPHQPHRRSANTNMFNQNKAEVRNQHLILLQICIFFAMENGGSHCRLLSGQIENESSLKPYTYYLT